MELCEIKLKTENCVAALFLAATTGLPGKGDSMENMEELFKEKYCALIEKFAKDVGMCTAGEKVPAIHIPIIGNQYTQSPVKIAFFGIETKGWLSFREFMQKCGVGDAAGSPEDAYMYLTQSTSPVNYLEWTNNFHASFFDYIFQFLTAFYKLPDPKFINNAEHKDLLESFIWGNANSFVSREKLQNLQVEIPEDWDRIKRASKIFDTAEYVLDICKPDIAVIMNWNVDDAWFTGEERVQPVKLEPHHSYYKIKTTHIYKASHPQHIHKSGIGFQKSIQIIIGDYETRKGNEGV